MVLHNDVFKQQIWEFFSNDLESCLQVAQIKQILPEGKLFPGGLNFTGALVIFSVIDLVAGYYVGEEPTVEDISKFISRYLGKYETKFKNNRELAKRWYKVFRNGLSHQWLPKFGGISMNFTDTEATYFSLSGSEEIPVLNVLTLFAQIKRVLVDFEEELNKNKKMQAKFNERYEDIVRKDFKEMEIFRNLWKKK